MSFSLEKLKVKHFNTFKKLISLAIKRNAFLPHGYQHILMSFQFQVMDFK